MISQEMIELLVNVYFAGLGLWGFWLLIKETMYIREERKRNKW